MTRVLRAGVALVVLVLLLVGSPLALAALAGWPLPTAWPNGEQLRFASRGGLGDTFWIKAFAVVVWVAWAQLAMGVIGEVGAARHRTRSGRSGWASAVAGRLVGALLIGSGAMGHVPLAGAAAPSVAVQVASLAAAPVAAAPVAAAAALPAVTPSPVTHVVVPGESLSSIAEDELGTQAAWPYLWESNRGRAFGHRVFEDPDLILPGWDLAVPGSQPIPPAAPPVEPAPTLEPVPTGSAVLIPPLVISAADRIPAALDPPGPATPETAAGARAVAPATTAGEVSGDGPVTAAGDLDGSVASRGAHDPAPAGDATEAVGQVGEVDASAASDASASAPAWARFAAFTGAALLATGAAGMLLSARRRALRSAGRSSVVAPVEGEVADTVTALAAGSDSVAMARLELALRSLAGQLGRAGSEARLLAARQSAEGLEAVLDRPALLDLPWLPGLRERCWELPATVPLAALVDDARTVAPPCPALIGVGRDDDGAEVYLDLEAAGVLDLGPGESGLDALRLVAATLAVTPLADELRIVTVGAALPELAARHDVQTVPDLAAAVAEVEAITGPIAAVTGGVPSTFRLRAVAGHEPWEPVVVLVAGPLDEAPAWDALCSLAAGHRGVAVVGVGLPSPVETPVTVAAGRLSVAGWTVRPHGLSAGEVDLLTAAAEAGEHSVEEAVEPPAEPEGADEAPAWSLMVRVLGPVDVVTAEGRVAAFDRPKALELVVWLAQHPHTSTRSGARSALWEADVSNASFSNVVSDARRGLARLVPPLEGEEWLARTYADRLPLHAGVVLDADLVRGHLARARRLPDDAAVAELRQALALVRGAPYAGRAYLWPDAEALPSTLTLLVTSVATELGERLLDRGEVDEVLAATAVGLDVLPGHEELVALRLRAHGARGDRAALRREYACYEQSLLADPWAGDPAPALVELRLALLDPMPVAGS